MVFTAVVSIRSRSWFDRRADSIWFVSVRWFLVRLLLLFFSVERRKRIKCGRAEQGSIVTVGMAAVVVIAAVVVALRDDGAVVSMVRRLKSISVAPH